MIQQISIHVCVCVCYKTHITRVRAVTDIIMSDGTRLRSPTDFSARI